MQIGVGRLLEPFAWREGNIGSQRRTDFLSLLQAFRIADAVNGPTGAASADGHIEIAVKRVYSRGRRRKAVVPYRLQKHFGMADVTGAATIQGHEVNPSERPIA